MIARARGRCRTSWRGSPARRASAPRQRRSARAAAAFSGCPARRRRPDGSSPSGGDRRQRIRRRGARARAASDQAGHAGIDVQDGGRRQPRRPRRRRRASAHAAISPGWFSTGIRPCSTNSASVPARRAVQHGDSGRVRAAPRAARCPRPAWRRRSAGSPAAQRARDRARAQPIAIGLDHGGDAAGAARSASAANWRRWRRDRFREPRRARAVRIASAGHRRNAAGSRSAAVSRAGQNSGSMKLLNRRFGLEKQLDGADRAVALLGDDQVGLVVASPGSAGASCRSAPRTSRRSRPARRVGSPRDR